MKRNPFRLMAVLAAGALILTACGSDDGDEGDDPTSADAGAGDDGDATAGGGGDAEGSLKVGIKFDQPGLGLRDGSEYVGMDVDVARAVAEKLGYTEDQIEWVESPSAQRETMLQAGQVDLIFATYSITDSRKESVQFAGPYFVAGQDLLVAQDSDITGPEGLDGKILCSVTGSTSAENVKEEVPGVQLQEYGTYSECVEQLSNGTIDAVTTDDVILAGFAAQEAYAGSLKVVGAPFSEELYGVGLNQEDERCEDVNEALTALWEDGTMEQIIEDNVGAAGYTPNPDTNPAEAGGHCA